MTTVNIKNAKYKTNKSFVINNNGKRTPIAKGFIVEAISETGDSIMTSIGLIKKADVQKYSSIDGSPVISERDKKINDIAYTASAVGLVSGLVIAYVGKKPFWGYIGRSLLFSIVGSVAGMVVGQIVVPKEKVVAPAKADATKTENADTTAPTKQTK